MIPDGNFSKKSRLVKTQDFRRVYKTGASFRRDFLVVYVAPNSLPLNRVGFSISARSTKKANRRNRIRRLFREVFRKNKNMLKSGFDIVLVVKKDPGSRFRYQAAEKIFLGILKKSLVAHT